MCMMSLFSSLLYSLTFEQNIETILSIIGQKKNCQNEQGDILISKNQVLQILCLKHHVAIYNYHG